MVRGLVACIAAVVAAACAPAQQQVVPAMRAVDESQELIRACRYDEADRALTEKLAAASADERPVVLLALGSVAEHRGDLAGALRRYEAAAAGDAVPLDAFELLGLAEVRAKRFEAGYGHLHMHIAANLRERRLPSWPETAAASLALAELGRLDEALQLLDGALAAFDYADPLLPDLRTLVRQAKTDGRPHAGEFWKMAYGSDREVAAMDLDYPPRPIKRVAPRYPEAALRNGTQGGVMLRLDIDETGSVTTLKVVESTPKGVFDDAAKRAVKDWKFQPATERCVPVKHAALQYLQFRISR